MSTNPIDCYSCGQQLAEDEIPDQDNDGNWYHPECGERLRSNLHDEFEAARQELIRDTEQETGYTADF